MMDFLALEPWSMNAPTPHAALAPVQASDLAALPLIEKWISFATVSRDSNLPLLDWTLLLSLIHI